MAIAGTWKRQASDSRAYASVLKQGTGINPIHAVRDNSGRNIAPDGTSQFVDPVLTANFDDDSQSGFVTEDLVCGSLYGDNSQTGLADRPGYGESDELFRQSVQPDWPTPGKSASGLPGGRFIRSLNKGATINGHVKTQQPEGLLNDGYKLSGEVRDAGVSDPSQYVMNTSMVQRDQVRAGSQTPEGRANEYDAPIKSRIPGQRIPVWSGGYRHEEMEPRGQTATYARPFFNRTAGTGPVEWMEPNEMYVSAPLQRVPVGEPYTGPQIGTDTPVQGFTDEDLQTAGWY